MGTGHTAGSPADRPDGPPPDQEEPVFRQPFSPADRLTLMELALTESDGAGSPVPGLALSLLEATERCRDRAGTTSLTPQQTLSALRALEIVRRRIDGLSTHLLAQFDRSGTPTDHGYRTTEALLAGEFRIAHHEARRRAALARQLGARTTLLGEQQEPAHPAIAEHYEQDRLSADEARTLCTALEELPPHVKREYGERIEATLMELAPGVRLTDVPELTARIISLVDPDGTPPQFAPEPQKHHITLTQKVNGDWRVSGLLDCPTGTVMHSLLYARMRDTDAEVQLRPRAGRGMVSEAQDSGHGAGAGGSGHGASDSSAECGSVAENGSAAERGSAAQQGSAEQGGSAAQGGSAEQSPAVRREPAERYEPVQRYEPAQRRESTPRHESAQRAEPAASTPAPREAVWERTDVSVTADGGVCLTGGAAGAGTILPDDPGYLLKDDGWPLAISDRIAEAVAELHEEAQEDANGTACRTLWEKTLGRVSADVTGRAGSAACPRSAKLADSTEAPAADVAEARAARSTSAASGASAAPGTATPAASDRAVKEAPFREPAATGGQLRPPPHPPDEAEALTPLVVGGRAQGVREDGSRSEIAPEPDSQSPGRHRHDRLAFLLRCLSRQRVLHGADHALVVTAGAQDLGRPDRPLPTQTGGTTTLRHLESWSQAGQLFAHIAAAGGRTLAVHSTGRFATRTQMTLLTARDQGCTFPDCDAPAAWCEAHHIVPAAEGGPTHVDNLTLACPFHHRWFERSGWSSTFRPGLPAWIPPPRIDRERTPVFHSRFRAALLKLPPLLGSAA